MDVGVPCYNLKKLYYQIRHTIYVDRYLARGTGDLASTAGGPQLSIRHAAFTKTISFSRI